MIKKFDDFEVGYRKGVLFALTSLLSLAGTTKVKEDKMLFPLRIYIQALIDKLDLFIDYGSSLVFSYSEHDKKGIPQKAEVFKSRQHWFKTQKMKLLFWTIEKAKEQQNEQL